MRSFWAGKNEFSCKKTAQSVIYHRTKNQKKLLSHSWEKWHMDRKPWFYRTLRRTGVEKTKLTQGYLSLFAGEKFYLENWQWYLNYISLSGYNCPSVFEFPRSVLFLWPHHHSPRRSSKSLRNFREIGTLKRTLTQTGETTNKMGDLQILIHQKKERPWLSYG